MTSLIYSIMVIAQALTMFFSEPASYTPPYKVYSALLTQSGTNAPTATVFENTIGNIVWTREGTGYYYGTLANTFTVNKTFVIICSGYSRILHWNDDDSDVNKLSFSCQEIVSGWEADAFNTTIEIRVYP